MPFTPAERAAMIERYARGPALLKAALAKVPHEAFQWRPGPKRRCIAEIAAHCAYLKYAVRRRLLAGKRG